MAVSRTSRPSPALHKYLVAVDVDHEGAPAQQPHRRPCATKDGPNASTDRDPIDPGQHQVEDDEVWLMTVEQVQCLCSVARRYHPEPFALQVQLEEGNQLVVVVHDENHCLAGVHRLLGWEAVFGYPTP